MIIRSRRTIGSKIPLNKSGIPSNGLVFYAPLWDYNLQAYGTVTNGTGVATGSPITLALAGNTVTVTTQGTFTIYVRGSGTAASGTATVTGSPVTLSAGSTTITVVGTGTITVTLNNTFFEQSTNHGLITTVAATYGSQGRTFGGTTGSITTPQVATLNNLAAMTAIVWMKPASTGEGAKGCIIRKSDSSDAVGGWAFYMSNANTVTFAVDCSGVDLLRYVSDSTLTMGAWVMVTLTWDGSLTAANVHIYKNLTEVTYQTTTNGTVGRVSDAAQNLSIGGNTADDHTFDGIIGESILYNRVISTQEMISVYQLTRWRYSI